MGKQGQGTSLTAHQPQYVEGENGNHNAYKECKNNGTEITDNYGVKKKKGSTKIGILQEYNNM